MAFHFEMEMRWVHQYYLALCAALLVLLNDALSPLVICEDMQGIMGHNVHLKFIFLLNYKVYNQLEASEKTQNDI